MSRGRIELIRNIVLAGPLGSGKTSLLEAILAHSKVIRSPGSIEERNTFSDSLEAERTAGHSILSTFTSFEEDDHEFTIIDTPGHPDFIGQVTSVLPAVESFGLVVAADEPIAPHAAKLMKFAQDLELCEFIVINKIDSPTADPKRTLFELQQLFGKRCLPINLPTDQGSKVLDVFFHHEGQTDLGDVRDAHQKIIDQIIELDDTLTEQYLSFGENFDPQVLHDAFEKALRSGHLIPVCFTGSRTSESTDTVVGIHELVDFFKSLLPNPKEGNFAGFRKGSSALLHVTPDPSLHTIAHVFYIRQDPFRGKLALCRVHQGTMSGNSSLFVGSPREGESKKALRPGHLYQLHGHELHEIETAIPGAIVAIPRANELYRNSVLHSHHEEDFISFADIELPEPLVGRAVSVTKRSDEQKFSEALTRIIAEDCSLKITRDQVTNEVIIYGTGELHLRTIFERLSAHGHLELTVSVPRISYRETVRFGSEGHCRHKKQTGGAGQFAEVYLKIEPLQRGEGFVFEDAVVGGAIPYNFIPAVEKGVLSAVQEGVLAGYPIEDVKVTVYDGKHHPVDSKEIAFFTAGKKAFIDACLKAGPSLLEPIMLASITVPSDCLGELTGNIVSRRGRIIDTLILETQSAVITAEVPLASLQDYQSELRGLTGGRGNYSAEFARYEFVPEAMSNSIKSSSASR